MSCFVSVYDIDGHRMAYLETRSPQAIASIRFEDKNGDVHVVHPAQVDAIASLRSQISNLQAELDRAKAELAATQVRLTKAYDRLNFDDCKLSDDERPIFIVGNMESWAHMTLANAHTDTRKFVEGVAGKRNGISIYKKIGTLKATTHVETKWEDA